MTFQEYVAAELQEQSDENATEQFDDFCSVIVEIDYTTQEWVRYTNWSAASGRLD